MNDKQKKTPLFTALQQHANKKPVPFHIPGHKQGVGMDAEFRQFIGQNALSIDLISIQPLDDIHYPRGVILEAQQLAAAAFGADHTFFTVQGTSGAIIAMILSALKPGDKIILPRNVHKSVLTAVILAEVNPIFIHPQLDKTLGIAHGITAAQIEEQLQKHNDVKAVLVINPTYYGIAGNLKEIVEKVHRWHIPILVDEAHGVLTHFHPDMPISAMAAGADMAATSVHKLGGSLTQSSILNVQGNLINHLYVQKIFSMLTTTSASYLLLSSLDSARRYLALHGKEQIGHALKLANFARDHINQIPGLYCMGKECLTSDATHDLDETKLFIHLQSLNTTGTNVEKWLRKHYNIEVELSDLHNILCLITPGDTEKSIQILLKALSHLSAEFFHPTAKNHVTIHLPEIPELILSPRHAFYSNSISIPLSQAAGYICAEFIMIYPPGIPILMPGEKITTENILYIQENIAAGLILQGTEDPTIQTIKVIKYD